MFINNHIRSFNKRHNFSNIVFVLTLNKLHLFVKVLRSALKMFINPCDV